jgi:energy-coupling factor transporter ATP-binding protein EcfA2
MIEVRNLSKRYKKLDALKNVSFDIEQGDIFGYIGPNGAGKTTTIKILATLLLPTGPFVLGYAVDANWWMPISQPVDLNAEIIPGDAVKPRLSVPLAGRIPRRFRQGQADHR